MKLFAFFLAGLVCYGADGDTAKSFFAAIRNNDLAGLKAMIAKGEDVNVRGDRDTTPLMYASAFGSLEAVRLLIDAKADVNAKNAFEMTALHWSVTEPEKAKLLIDHGADVNARTKIGRTALIVAGLQNHSDRVVDMLLAKGADVKVADNKKQTFLLAAASAKNPGEVRLAVMKGADVNGKDELGFTPLMNAAAAGDLESVRFLLAKGADVNAISAPEGGTVKNGKITLGSFTALMMASVYGPPEIVDVLLKAGAKTEPRDVRGMTALHFAVMTESQNPAIVSLLLKAGAKQDVKSLSGETPADWAAKYFKPAVMKLFAVSTAAPAGGSELAGGAHSSREAVERGLKILNQVSDSFMNTGGCVSCHAQSLTTFASSVAGQHGFPINVAAQKGGAEGLRAFVASQRDGLLIRLDVPGNVDQLGYWFLQLSSAGAAADTTTDAMAHNLAAQQLADGSWHSGGFARAPMSDGDIERTAAGLRAFKLFGSEGRRAELERRIELAHAWLLKAKPIYNEDYAMQILGLKWAGDGAGVTGKYARKLLDLQRTDGGWAQNPNLLSDAYATGQSLYALSEAGALKPSDAAFQRGVQFLLRTQHEDGTWHVKSRSSPLQPYFQSGFPYDHDQWISMAGTAWATAALSIASEPATVARLQR